MSLPQAQYAEVETSRIRITPTGKVSRQDAAKILGKSVGTLANWATLGYGPKVHMIGGRVFHDYSECAAMANGEKPIKPAVGA